MDQQQCVFVVDDDPRVRKALEFSIRAARLPVEVFSSAEEFLASHKPRTRGCIVLDVKMPGKSGLELQETLLGQGIDIPIVFLTGHGTVPMCVQALHRGAVDFVEKPCRTAQLLARIRRALEIDRETHARLKLIDTYNEDYALLTDREREVMELLVDGHETKGIARRLGIVVRTVANHQAAVLEKMKVANVALLTKRVLTMRQMEDERARPPL